MHFQQRRNSRHCLTFEQAQRYSVLALPEQSRFAPVIPITGVPAHSLSRILNLYFAQSHQEEVSASYSLVFFFSWKMGEPKKGGCFYKLRVVPCCRRESLQACSFHGLFSPSPWIGNLVTNHFLNIFLQHQSLSQFQRHVGENCLSLEFHVLFFVCEMLIHLHEISLYGFTFIYLTTCSLSHSFIHAANIH